MTDRNRLDRNARYSRPDDSGAFDIDILNTLGRDQKAQRAKLYQLAIKNPENYLEKRQEALEKIVDDQVRHFYVLFKELLKQGTKTTVGVTGNTVERVTMFPDGSAYQPMLPDATIQKFCISVTETIEDICEKAFEEIYPKDHKDLAVKKMFDMNKSGL